VPGGRIFARIPYFRKLNLRETIGIRGAYGTISDDSRALNASGINYRAPENVYWEYNAGIGNIFNVLFVISKHLLQKLIIILQLQDLFWLAMT
jgi:hypothetical protein